MEYWTEEDIAEARANGINYKTFYARVYQYEWTVEKAKTTPTIAKGRTNQKYPSEIMELAAKNGIYKNLFYKRINHEGMTPEMAATKPISERKKYPEEYVAKAKANGVRSDTFRRRIRIGWTYEEAIKPPLSKSEAAKLAMKKRWSKTDFNYAK